MTIIHIDSDWRATGIVCPFCNDDWMTYSDGVNSPQCSNNDCLAVLPDGFIYRWLITIPECRGEVKPTAGELADYKKYIREEKTL